MREDFPEAMMAAPNDALKQLQQRVRAWSDAGGLAHNGPAWQLLAGSLRQAIQAGQDDLLADLVDSLSDAGLATDLSTALQNLVDLDPYVDAATLQTRIRELFALPVRILFDGQADAWVLGKPFAPDALQGAALECARLFGDTARVQLLPGFFDRRDLLSPWPSGADALRRLLSDPVAGASSRSRIAFAAQPLQATRLRRSFVRFVVGVADRDFAGGRTLTERRFADAPYSVWKSATEAQLDAVLATMGSGMSSTVARPTTFSHALTQELHF